MSSRALPSETYPAIPHMAPLAISNLLSNNVSQPPEPEIFLGLTCLVYRIPYLKIGVRLAVKRVLGIAKS